MTQYISKSALVAEIENLVSTYKKCPTRNSYEDGLKDGRLIGYKDALHKIDTLEVKEVDLELITGWFDHIAQIADDRMTLTRQRMTDAHALDEIKCIAKNSSEFITKYYKTQKGEKV
jgi:hypothetical protein